MRTTVFVAIGLLFFGLVACSGDGFKAKAPDNNQPQKITGPYCVSYARFGRHSTEEPPSGIKCLQENGQWLLSGGEVDDTAECGEAGIERYGYGQFLINSKGEPVIVYERCPGFPDGQIVAKKWTASGWQLVGTTPINWDGSQTMNEMTQFGGYFEWGGEQPVAVWKTGWPKGIVSHFDGAAWSHQEYEDPEENGSMRHTQLYRDGARLLGYYAEPHPTIVEYFPGRAPEQLARITINREEEGTLYSSLTKFGDGYAMAYSTRTEESAWKDTNSGTVVAWFREGQGWQALGARLEETWGHDGITPFVFVINGELHAMYADYTTNGRPTDVSRIRFRFRVSKWNGSQWLRVGGESDALTLSQRFEFTQNGDEVLFTANRPSEEVGVSEQVVLIWRQGQFLQAGGPVRTIKAPESRWSARPGNVVVMDAKKGSQFMAHKYQKKSQTEIVPLCAVNRGGWGGGFRLRPISPVIDAGTADISIPGQCFYNDASPDIGASEFQLD